jgi:hypothetical protein
LGQNSSSQNFPPGDCVKKFSPPQKFPKNFPLTGLGKNFWVQKLAENSLKRKVADMRRLTEREWQWLWEYTRTGSNASQAARIVYGGTPISVRVKGHKKKVKLKPILDRILDKWNDWAKDCDQIEREVDAYLKRLKRRACKSL